MLDPDPDQMITYGSETLLEGTGVKRKILSQTHSTSYRRPQISQDKPRGRPREAGFVRPQEAEATVPPVGTGNLIRPPPSPQGPGVSVPLPAAAAAVVVAVADYFSALSSLVYELGPSETVSAPDYSLVGVSCDWHCWRRQLCALRLHWVGEGEEREPWYWREPAHPEGP